MEYISVAEASQKWGVSLRQVQRLVAADRIPGAQKLGRAWMIPLDAAKPIDPRGEKKTPQNMLFSDLSHVIAATAAPMPGNDPDAILDTVREERFRLQYEGELAYLRGDFQTTMRCFHKTEGDDAARLRASLVAVAAAISLGDYRVYSEIEDYLKSCIEAYPGSDVSAVAELALASVAVSATAPNMVPDWLKEGDFSARPILAKPYTFYLRARYFLCTGSYETMLAVAQTALTLSTPEQGITFTDIYLRMTCAIACHQLEREDAARHFLLSAMRICLPHGFITPFAETV
ncbi:MAG: helix-turn-helix domain-containing protein, partial [Bacillota bacterium]